ncbi:SusD-like starch-binding protein associating with outer membrane [Chitinophaga niastensis]|uniref:SusD-like starch-binding protein associating with outer membrane n=1 Tax=Chitinophaga niastensis TaxID=536980 RepID=A0A2P8HBX6_CHINA|nr:SusD/RagB family nutrient-binding outer membrane lipoprotein [Chitinophaga niastensis]PSL43728.1 SusD-like starch-binding protein associating with outer membrane [Chitinophaga niastensis]
MKRLHTIIYIALLGIWITGCKKELDINTNPNQAAIPPMNGLLATTTYNTSLNVYHVSNITSYFVQYLASPNANGATDTYESTDYSTTWQLLYYNMRDIHDLIEQATAAGATKHVGAAEVMMAINLEMVNDLWGSGPYTQAFNVNILQPAYTADDSIYTRCLLLLDDGIAQLNKTGSRYDLDASKDLIHGGVTSAWIKTAYAVKARIFNHLTKKSNYDPTAVLTAIANAYTGNADDAQLLRFQSLSPWNGVAINNANNSLDGWLSTHFINALNGKTFGIFDPRLPLMTDTTKFGDYRGTINGAGRIGSGTNKEECYLTKNGFYSKSGAPLLVVTNAECRFIEAEAAFRSGDKNRAYQAYVRGITANMDKIGVDTAKRNAYLLNPAVGVGMTNITLDLILKEKYVAQFLHPDTWNDARRYDYQYKDFKLPVNAQLPAFIRRVAYPDTEKSRNGDHVPAVQLTDHIWWDGN